MTTAATPTAPKRRMTGGRIALFGLGAGGIAFAAFGKQILQFLGVQV